MIDFKSARQKYQVELEVERSKKEKQPVEGQEAIILSEIEDVKSQITLLTKTSLMEKGRPCQVGGSIIAPEGGEEEETKVSTFVCFLIYLVLKVYIFFLV